MKLFVAICESNSDESLKKGYDIFEAMDYDKAFKMALSIKDDYISDKFETSSILWEKTEKECAERGIDPKDWTMELENVMWNVYDKDIMLSIAELNLHRLPSFDIDELLRLLKKNPDDFISEYNEGFLF